jgi:glyoxylase-like metal-dependent hydrolase (beta-lactamase superfamily II)
MTTSGRCTVEIIQSRFWQTNTGIIIGPHGEMVLIDPGVFPDELAALAQRNGEGRVLAPLATHEDWDHVLWSSALGSNVPRMAHPDVVRILNDDRPTLLRSLTQAEEEFGVTWEHDLVGRLESIPTETIEIGDHIRLSFTPTPGHTPVHTSIMLEGEGVLFAGDMLSDVDPPILADSPGVVTTYLASLSILEDLIQEAGIVVPGHGSACDRSEALLRLDRDRRCLDVISGAARGAALTDIAVATAGELDDPRLAWDEGWNAHLSNIGIILRDG